MTLKNITKNARPQAPSLDGKLQGDLEQGSQGSLNISANRVAHMEEAGIIWRSSLHVQQGDLPSLNHILAHCCFYNIKQPGHMSHDVFFTAEILEPVESHHWLKVGVCRSVSFETQPFCCPAWLLLNLFSETRVRSL